MGLQFNTNVSALNSLFQLQQTNNAVAASIQRLSTGLRINSPADDPAGFVIANSLQTQVAGINQAIANTQSAANLVKTVTGGLSQINSLISTIRASALDAANNVSINPAAAQADQTAITNALTAINSIAQNTQYGSQKLLNGAAGVSASVTNGTLVGGINIGGTFAGNTTQNGNITITVNNAATRAAVTGAAVYSGGINSSVSTVNGGSGGTGGTVTINGQSVTVVGSDTVQTLINRINNVAGTTGVAAAFDNTTNRITLTQANYGANFKILESESSSLITNGAGASIAGANATVTVTATTVSNGVATATSNTFVGGRGATDSGLRVSDSYGNSLLLTEAGNTTATSNAGVGSASAGSVQFQIGANAGQTANVALNGVSPSNLGTTSVPGQSLATIDVMTASGAANALLIVNEAGSQISQYQAQLGSFQTNVLQSTQNYLNNTVLSLSDSIGRITNTDFAAETVKLTNLQLIQQSGISALYMAKNESALYLRLLS